MDETTLQNFFLGKIRATQLASEIARSLIPKDDISTVIQIHKGNFSFVLTRETAVKLCQAVLAEELPAVDLKPIAFVLLASECFTWDDDLLAEVIHDWAAPEINYPLSLPNVVAFRECLLGTSVYPGRLQIASRTGQGLVSQMFSEFV